MIYHLLADAVLLVHLAFVVFVVIGGVVVLRWPRVGFVHVPAVVWGALIEFAGWVCPLTPLENALREAGGGGRYAGAFIDQHVAFLLYPAGLTRGAQAVLGTLVLLLNALVYWRVATRARRGPPPAR